VAFFTVREPYVPAFVPARTPARTSVGVSVDVGPKAAPTDGFTPIAEKGGTGLVTTEADVERYIGLLEPLLESLDRDVRRYLVWNDPKVLAAAAKSFAKTWPDKAAELQADADELAARAAPRPAEQVKREIAFSADWRKFFEKWPYDKSEKGCTFQACRWDRIEGDDLQYQAFHRDFEGFGYTATRKVPPHKGPSATPWGWIAFGVILLGVGIVLTQARAIFGG
jgi:hypothetical protein